MAKIILTCFEPFGQRMTNMSCEVISKLSYYKSYCLPVSWENIRKNIENIIENENPDILILTGEASSYNDIKIECEAHNIANFTDNYGITKNNEPIIKSNQDTLKTSLILENINIEKSYDAGKYLCNCSYYYALNYKHDKKVLFIHFPINKEIDYLVSKVKDILEQLENNN